jgi:hypothetical protein
MRARLLLAAVTTTSLLAGCSSQPSMNYQQAPTEPQYQGDMNGLSKFSLAKSTLFVNYADPEKKTGAVLVSTPEEAEANGDLSQVNFMMEPSGFPHPKTHLQVTKRANTQLLESVGTTIEDTRTKTIGTVGGIVVALVGVLPLDAPLDGQSSCPNPKPTAVLPLVIDTEAYLNETHSKAADQNARSGAVEKRCVMPVDFDLKFGPVPNDAVARATYLEHIKQGPQEVMFYSACRPVTITFTTEPLKGQQFTTTVADPNFIQTVKLPAKGKVDMHSACGVNTTSEASGASSTADIVSAIIGQVKNVREAWKTNAEKKDAK